MTEIISLPRFGGKTTELIRRMEEDPNLVLVSVDQRHASELYRAVNQKRRTENLPPLSVDRFISLDTAMGERNLGRLQETRFLLDNLDLMLSRLLGTSVEAATITSSDES